MRILILRFSSLGDVVLATAPVHALAAKYPDAELIVGTKLEYAPVFDNFPPRLTLKPFTGSQSVASYIETLGERSFDMVVDLHGSLRSRTITRRLASPDRRRVNKNTLKRWLMVWSKKGLDHPLSVVDSYLDLVGANRSKFRPRLVLSNEERSKVDSANRNEALRIGIGWGAKHPTKVVPPETWRKILFATSAHSPIVVKVFGMHRDETGVSGFIRNELSKIDSVTSETHIGLPLREAMIRISSCDAFLSSDSGLMHVADALGVPTFGLFGPTHPALGFAPAGEKSRAFHAGTWCSPCHRHGSAPCFRERRFCFDELDVEDIAKSLLAVNNSTAGKASM